jgi:hypothetical protein
MTFLWLIVWLIGDTPPLHQWNVWLVSLIICVVIDGVVIDLLEAKDTV